MCLLVGINHDQTGNHLKVAFLELPSLRFYKYIIQYSSVLLEKVMLLLHCEPKLWAAVLPGIHLPDSDTLNPQYDLFAQSSMH